jgi:transketolase
MGQPWKLESVRTHFGEALRALGEQREDVVVVGADTTQSLKTAIFGKEFPDRFFNIGIAEQNMMGVAAGLAASGKIAFACTYSVFGTAQVYNIIRQSIAYPRLNVKIFSSHAGITVGPDGATHQMLEDVALLRGLPNMTVLVPVDGPEMAKCVLAAAEWLGPVYCRFSRTRVPVITAPEDPFEIGRATIMREGDDVALVANGIMVSRALLAAEELEREGISARVINLSTVKPLDVETLEKAASDTGAIVTAEEHTIIHGTGAAVASALAQNHPVPISMVAVNDMFGESGQWDELMEKYGLTARHIIEAAKDAMARRDAA